MGGYGATAEDLPQEAHPHGNKEHAAVAVPLPRPARDPFMPGKDGTRLPGPKGLVGSGQPVPRPLAPPRGRP